MSTIDLADADANLETLVDRVEAGDTIDIIRDGKVVARLIAETAPRKPIDLAMLQKLSDAMPRSRGDAGEASRSMRDTDRY